MRKAYSRKMEHLDREAEPFCNALEFSSWSMHEATMQAAPLVASSKAEFSISREFTTVRLIGVAPGVQMLFISTCWLSPTAVTSRLPTMFTRLQEMHMADDKSKPSGQDRERINVHQDYELHDWSKKLAVTRERLKGAVAAVDARVDKVRDFLKLR